MSAVVLTCFALASSDGFVVHFQKSCLVSFPSCVSYFPRRILCVRNKGWLDESGWSGQTYLGSDTDLAINRAVDDRRYNTASTLIVPQRRILLSSWYSL